MDTATALTRFQATLTSQLALGSGDPAVEAAGDSLLGALGPATRQLAMELAEQAATEVAAQLPGHHVEVVLRDGEPALSVRAQETAGGGTDEDYEARITLRLPPSLKALVEDAAGSSGDSVNSWVVRTLSGVASRPRRAGRHVRGTVQT